MVERGVFGEGILVIGGGISGLTTALEAAEAGCRVVLVEKEPFLGGRVARLNKYYTKLCPPSCGLEINFKRLKRNQNIKYYTMAEVESVSGEEGNYQVAIKVNPRYVNENCTACGECSKVCTTEISDDFNLGMNKTKAAFIPYNLAFPQRYVISPEIIGTDEAKKCLDACKYNAVDLDMQPEAVNVNVGSIVITTGWQPYDPENIDNLGFKQYENVITNVMMERLASQNGPTEGKIIRPSDGKEVENVIFAQCAGSRDENHLPYCSGVCCLASLKQATYIREQYPDSKVKIFYIDLRALGRFEQFLTRVQNDENVSLIKGKVARVEEDPASKNPIVEVEDTLTGEKLKAQADLVVLATGIVPNTLGGNIPVDITCDDFGFVVSDPAKTGVYGAGCAKRPTGVAQSVQDATGAALKAIQSTLRR
ncbi:MAG: CoB--CoM heterodisulfide reductase iron-sulfur subunit A family protein [Thermodesulfobacteriota bacterium]|nr:CoB--CoM heterodisulfide reductase iron-sulfur subunit A family protein [Thermodesulfobacteriota bacterium]